MTGKRDMDNQADNSIAALHDGPALITGAAGFIGANVVRRLVAAGVEVHALLRAQSAPWRLAGIEGALHIHACSLLDEEALTAVVRRVKPRYIYHLATHGAYPTQTDADRIIRTNLLGTWNLLRACNQLDYALLVNTGSSSEYGFKDHAMRETDLVEPNSYYAVAKCAQSLLAGWVAHDEGRAIVTLRPFAVYGPYEEPSRLVPTLVRNCLTGRPLELVNPEIARDFIYIDDVLDAYLKTEELRRHPGEVLNIGTGMQTSIGEIVETVLRVTGADVPLRWGAMPARPWDSAIWVADASKARRLLGWRARHTLEAGIRKTAEWMRPRLERPEA